MTTDTFWKIIEESREAAGGVISRQEGELAELLSLLPPDEIVAFQAHLDLAMRRAYRSELWAAACVIGRGCSDDTFLDFRACIIAHGREVFERVLTDPEELLQITTPATAEAQLFYEGLLYVPANVFEAQTNQLMPPSIVSPHVELDDASWDESEESLQQLLPRLFFEYRT